MLAPSGDVVQRGHRCAELRQHARGDRAGRAVGAVEDDAQAVEAAPLQSWRPGAPRRAATASGSALMRPTPWPVGRRGGRSGSARTASSSRSISPSTSTGSFVPSRLKSLIPLSPNGLCEAEMTAPGALRVLGHRGHAGRGQHAEVDDVGALGGQTGREGGLEQGPRAARVAADDEGRGGRGRGRRRARGPAPARASAPRSRPRARRRCRSGSAPLRRATAWSTAAPCGPSSGRTSSTPSRGRRG